jgi:RNA polymerase sigma factor (sigma-70 family)
LTPQASESETRYLDLVTRNHGRITRLCRAWSRTSGDLEDLRSEVLFQLWRAWPSFDGRASEDTWLYRVALNVALQSSRRARRQKLHVERLEREAPPASSAPPPSATFEESERLERLRRALTRLDPGERALIALALEDLSHQEIAEVTGLSAGHVAVKLHRIRKRLAERLAEEENHAQR